MLYGPTCPSYEHVRVMVDPSSDWDGCYAPPCVVIVGSPASWCGRSRQLLSMGRVPSKKTEGSVLFVDSFRVRLTMTSCDVTWREPVLEPHQFTENERQDNSYSDHESLSSGQPT